MKLIYTYYKILKENENPFEVDKYFKSMIGDLGFYKYDYFVFTWKLKNSGMGNLPENELSIDLKNSNIIIGKNIIEPLIYAMDSSSEEAREYVLNWFTKNKLINNSETIKKIKETISFYIKRLNPANFELRFEYSLDAAGLMLGDALTEKLNKEEEISESDIEKRAYEISNLMISLTNRRKNEGNKENFNEYLQKKVFNYSLKMIGGNPNIYWTWFIDKKTDNLVIRDSKPFVFRLKTCHSQIPHSPHKNDPFFYINNEIVNFIHKDSNKQINEVRNMLVSWFIKNVYSNKNFRKIYIKDYIESMSQYHGLPKKYTKLDVLKRNFKNLKSQTLDKVILQKKAKEFYDGELLNIINNATENQEYYGSNFPSQLDEQTSSSQSGGSMVPSIVYDAIKKIESIYSFMENGKIKGATYSGNDKESYFKKYVQDTIGLDNWFKITEKLRAQIYAYAFQSDSGDGGMFFRWVAGLANAIDPSINRLSVVKHKLDDENVKNAINVIIKACKDGSINSYYDNYLKVLDQQYKSGDYNDNYKYIWKYRPIAIDRFMKGENAEKIFVDWKKSFTQKDVPIDNDFNF